MARGTLTQRSKGSWQLTYDLPPGPDGKRRQKTETVRGTKRDADKRLSEILHKLGTGEYVAPSKTTVASHLERWLATVARPTVGPTTYERYAGIVCRDLNPEIGWVSVTALRVQDVQALYSKWLAGGLSPATIRLRHAVLRGALDTAVKWGLTASNAALSVDLPKIERPERKAIEDSTMASLVDIARGTPMNIPVLLIVTAGMRVGEICGLRWGDINWEESSLGVARTAITVGGRVTFGPPKGRKSRTIPIPFNTKSALLSACRSATHRGDEDLVIGPVLPGSVSRAVRRLLKSHGIMMPMHGLRHAHASYLMRSSVPVDVVSERLGHSDPTITLRVYSHTLPRQHREASDKVQELFGEQC